MDRRIILSACVLLGLLTIALVIRSQTQDPTTFYSDFSASWEIARLALRDPALVYAPASVTQAGPWTYPPSVLLLKVPMVLLPLWWAYAVWISLSLLFYLAVASRMIGILGAAIILLAPPVWHSALFGQTTLLVGALLLAALLVMRRRPEVAGVLLGLAATIKPQAVVVAPFALVAIREWRALTAAIVAGLSVAFATVIAFGVDIWFDWLRAIPRFVQFQDTLQQIQIAPGQFVPFLPARALLALTGILLASITFRTTGNPASRLVALAVGSWFCSPYVPVYELAVIAPAALAFVLTFEDIPIQRWRAITGAVSVFTPVIAFIGVPILIVLNALAAKQVYDRGNAAVGGVNPVSSV